MVGDIGERILDSRKRRRSKKVSNLTHDVHEVDEPEEHLVVDIRSRRVRPRVAENTRAPHLHRRVWSHHAAEDPDLTR